jgi:integral membrane sensor domain MASE1/anti-sigma regulatory factor (Ser/Thr protein kinase)/PAS domain-containing protein
MATREQTPKALPGGLGDVATAHPWSYAASLLLVAVAYYAAAKFGLRLALVGRNITPFWPPTGIAVVAFILLGRSVWPGVALAAFAVNLPISTNGLAAAATAAGNTLAPLVAATLLSKVGFHRQIDRLRDATAIVFVGALLSMSISALVGTGTLVASGALPVHELPGSWAVWWAGDAMGVLVVTPFVLSLVLPRHRPRRARWGPVEAAVLFALIALVSLTAIGTDLQFMFLVIPLLGWAAWRFQQRGAAPAALLVVLIASWAAAKGVGPFQAGTLLEKMLMLQAFNATVAFCSFFFAALVTERMQAHQALERAAVELDARVRQRTSQLYATNLYLRNEVAEREESERKLRQQEAQLAEAQQVAHIGSWEWMIPPDRLSWSDEMYRIHGHVPQAFPAAFEMALAQVNTEDAARIRSNVEEALRRADDHDLPTIEYRISRDDGAERVLLGKAKMCVGPDGEPLRMFGTVQDVTEGRKAEREHRIAETLQRSLLPDRLPELPGVLLAARYVPASADMEVGGDWYDVVQLPNGQVGLAIGDVAGHGLRAASTMGQLRMGLRAYALEEPSPAKVVSRLDRLVSQLLESEIVTLVYLVLDLDSGMVRLANAGHPPPLVAGPEGQTSYLEDGLGSPLGCGDPEPVETSFRLVPGSTLLLFTDGLVEKRGVSIGEGLERLEVLAAGCDQDIETFCEVILGSMVKGAISDDVALLAIRPVPLAGGLLLQVPAEPRVLAPLRQTLRRWLREIDAAPPVANDILIACGEVCANVIQHAYGAKEGLLEISLGLCDGTAEVTVRDQGSWRPSSGIHGGHGLPLIQELMEFVEVNSGPDGTVVRMHRRISNGNGSDS